jgi:hypothetical protein
MTTSLQSGQLWSDAWSHMEPNLGVNTDSQTAGFGPLFVSRLRRSHLGVAINSVAHLTLAPSS